MSTASTQAGSSSPSERPSRRSRFVIRALLVLAPLILTGALELGLRTVGYGTSNDFFEEYEDSGRLAPNLDFVYRFYSRATAQDPPIPFMLPKEKGPRTYRIFVLGSSAAWGMPSASFNFGRMLEAMLRERYPDVRFEVCNTTIMGINSHIVRWTAEDCAEHEPDLFLVYLGNNEVIGLYGPRTDPRNPTAGSTSTRRLVEAWRTTRLRQLVDNLKPAPKDPGIPPDIDAFRAHWVAVDDPDRAPVWDNYRANLEAICATAKRAGARTLLSTVSVNLRDCAPFASLHRSDLTDEELETWQGHYDAGAAHEAQGAFPPALAEYAQALTIDDRYAELHFRVARCRLMNGDVPGAQESYETACTLDAYQCRADARLNDVVRDTAARLASEGVLFADAERAVKASPYAPGGLPGERLFYDHVHLTLGGNYEVARALYPKVVEALEADLGVQPASDEGPLSIEEVADRLGWTPWHAIRLRGYMLNGMDQLPFSAQLDHADWLEQGLQTLQEQAEAFGDEDFQRSHAILQRAVGWRPDDWPLHYELAMLFRETQMTELAKEELETVLQLVPCHEEAREGLLMLSPF